MAACYNELGQIEKAADYYKRAIAIDSFNVQSLTFLSNYYYNKKQNILAIKYFSKLVSINPDNPKIYYNIALCYAEIAEYNQALTNLDLAEQYGFEKDKSNDLRSYIKKFIK